MTFNTDLEGNDLTLSCYRDYDEVHTVLDYTNLSVSPAELQGFATAANMSTNQMSALDWLHHCHEVYASGAQSEILNDEDKRFLLAFYQSINLDLAENGLTFTLMIPDETCALSHRISEVGKWCQGFLLGFGLFVKLGALANQADLENLLIDIEKISNVEVPADEAFDQEEERIMEFDLFELTEFLKVAALTFYTEASCTENSPEQATQPDPHDMIH